jgi:hypothetical protein
MTTEDLREIVAGNVTELSEAIHSALLRKQYGEAKDCACALADAAAAYSELEGDE